MGSTTASPTTTSVATATTLALTARAGLDSRHRPPHHDDPRARSDDDSLTAAEEIRDLVRAAENLLASAGDAVVLCPVYGVEADR